LNRAATVRERSSSTRNSHCVEPPGVRAGRACFDFSLRASNRTRSASDRSGLFRRSRVAPALALGVLLDSLIFRRFDRRVDRSTPEFEIPLAKMSEFVWPLDHPVGGSYICIEQLLYGAIMPQGIVRQAERLYAVFAELIRRYQFRDRDQICCYGLSVSQCYALEALASRGSMAMGKLAEHLGLKISSVTRAVDQLVAGALARRLEDPKDRRVCRVHVTKKGRALVARIQKELVKEYERVLRDVPPESRETVVQAVARLLSAFEGRSACSAADPKPVRMRLPKAGESK